MSIGFGIAVSLVALTAAWSVGLAWHILALRRGWRRVLTYVLPGAALGAALSALAAAAFADIAGSLDEFGAVIRVLTLVWFGAWGALLGAATAWLIWLMRRPDRDVAPDIAAEFE